MVEEKKEKEHAEDLSEEELRNISTTELLNGVSDKNEDWYLRRQYEKELEKREPFDHLKGKIEDFQKQIKKLQEKVDRLSRHTHDHHTGKPVVPMCDEPGSWF